MNAWAGIEIGSAYLLAAILKTESQLAMAILGTVTSYNARRDIITNTARMVLVNEDDLNAVERICKRLARAAKRRNQIAHATLSYHPEHPGKLMVMNLSCAGGSWSLISACSAGSAWNGTSGYRWCSR